MEKPNKDQKDYFRQPTETNKAYRAFSVYRDLGRVRTLEEVARKLGKSSQSLHHWTRKNNWMARVEEYDREHEELERAIKHKALAEKAQEWADRKLSMRDKEWDLAQKLIQRAEQMMNFPLVERRVERTQGDNGEMIVVIVSPAGWRFRDVTTFVDLASKLARLAVGAESDRTTVQGAWEDEAFLVANAKKMRHSRWVKTLPALAQVMESKRREELGVVGVAPSYGTSGNKFACEGGGLVDEESVKNVHAEFRGKDCALLSTGRRV